MARTYNYYHVSSYNVTDPFTGAVWKIVPPYEAVRDGMAAEQRKERSLLEEYDEYDQQEEQASGQAE